MSMLKESKEELRSRVYIMRIEELDLSVRSLNCLKRAGINTVNELIEMTTQEVSNIKNLSPRCYEEIVNKLLSIGVCLKKSNDTHNEEKQCMLKRAKVTHQEKKQLIDEAKMFLLSRKKEFVRNNGILFTKMKEIVDDEYCEAYGVPNDLLYEMICCEEIADVYFLHSKYSELKTKCIIECINRENYDLAYQLTRRMIRTSAYKDYNLDANDWMHSNLNTMMGVIAYYPLEEYMEWYNEPVTLDGRKHAVKLCEYILPFLDESLQKDLYSGLMFADDTLPLVSIDNAPKYVSLYLEDLFFIVENYARKPRRKSGFGDSMSINDATLRITQGFSNLIRMNRINELKQILDIIYNAGDDLKPINYNMFLNGIRHQFGEDVYEKISRED